MNELNETTPRRIDRLDALRYRWLRNNPAWETEAVLSSLSPEAFDQALDAAIARDRLTDKATAGPEK